MIEIPSLAVHLMELAAQATDRARDNKFEAEIDNCPACWHVIVTQPAREYAAAKHLMRRGFGIYLPELDERLAGILTKRPMFPTYLFIFVWGINSQWRRIASCTGVVRWLPNIGGDKPAVVPDDVIHEIQARELTQVIANLPAEKVPRGHKRLKRWQKELMAEVSPTATPKSYFSGVEAVDGAMRNSVLHRALNLPLHSGR
jgi:transcription antitermination factor NusG